jgi:N-formylglutamate amidohydrolase
MSMTPVSPEAHAAWFEADLPDLPSTPVVVSVPHAGIATAGFADPLAPSLDVRCDADLFVDALWTAAGVRGAFIRARLSRFVCDLNRHPGDVSARAVPDHPAPRNQDGRGFVWEVTTTGAPALARPLSLSEWEARRAVHVAYHDAIRRALDAAKARFGFALLVDGHSMPSVGRAGHRDPGRSRADIVPGDRDGTSCAHGLSALLVEHFTAHGLRVARNDPYKGGFVTAHHGRPAEGRHAIQIEMRRDLYMDEAAFAPLPEKQQRLAQILGGLLRRLDGFDPR